MEKFKLGDKVRITRNTNYTQNEIGDIGVITELGSIPSLKWRVMVEGRDNLNNFSREDEIELIESYDIY